MCRWVSGCGVDVVLGGDVWRCMRRWIVLYVSVVSIPVQPAVFQTWSLSDSWSSFHTSLQTEKGNFSHH